MHNVIYMQLHFLGWSMCIKKLYKFSREFSIEYKTVKKYTRTLCCSLYLFIMYISNLFLINGANALFLRETNQIA